MSIPVAPVVTKAPETEPIKAPANLTLAQELTAVEKKIGVWLDPAHILLIILLTISLVGGAYFFESKRADVAEARAQAATLVAKAAQDAQASSAIQNAAQQEKDKEIEAAMTAANQQLITANQQLQTSNASLVTKLVSQQKTDAALPPSAQAQRWEGLVPSAQVTATSAGFTVDPVGGLATLQALEQIPVYRSEIANLTTEVNNDKQEIANDAISLSAEKVAHSSDLANDQKIIVAANADNKKVVDEYNAYKKHARKNYFKAFFAGVVVGFFGGHAAGF